MIGGFVAILLAMGLTIFIFGLVYSKMKIFWITASAVFLVPGVVMGLRWNWSNTDCCLGIIFVLAAFYAVGVLGRTWRSVRL